MIFKNAIRKVAITAALVPLVSVAATSASLAQVSVGISVGVPPPPLPVYTQPVCPGDGYLWTPGYWGYNSGYYWVPGVWVQPPAVGVLWTPPYWGFAGGFYGFHAGYWGPTVGFYGGINYGFGYGGVGFAGGFWRGGAFQYNTAFANVNATYVHNTYVNNTNVNNNFSHVSYNGGVYGAHAAPTEGQLQATRSYGPTSSQLGQYREARQNPGQYANANGGRPGTYAMSTNRSGFGYGNEVNARQGNQQSRIDHGVNNGSVTPGEERNLENRDDSIHNEAQRDRAANGGDLTGAERQQINQRQNNVSNSIYDDRHNANDDAAAAARHGTTPNQERRTARHLHQQTRPRGPHADRN